MESWELHIENKPQRNWSNGQFLPGHITFNKGKPWSEWMDGRKAKRVKKYLKLGRVAGKRDKLHELNRKPIIGIKDGKLIAFNCAANTEMALRAKGIKANRRNICRSCHTHYQCGGFKFFFASNIEDYRYLII